MKRVVVSLLSLAVGAMPFGNAHSRNSYAMTPDRTSADPISVMEDTTVFHHTSVAAGVVSGEPVWLDTMVIEAPAFTREEELAVARRRLRDGEAGTYISEILEERDSSVARWPDRRDKPLTVWIQPWSSVVDFTPNLVTQVEYAFEEWGGLKLPVGFTFVDDSVKAEVHVTWIDRFKQPISGRTRWSRDDDWIITDANITLAVHHSQGDLLDEDSMRAMALHEIGHLLGLDHTSDSTSIMAPMVRARALSEADRATIRLVYSLPAGPLR